MATVYVTEFSGVGNAAAQNAALQAPIVPPTAARNNVLITGASAQCAAFNAATRLIRVHADSICSIAIGGVNPIATVADQRFLAGQTEYFVVTPGDKLAAIANT